MLLLKHCIARFAVLARQVAGLSSRNRHFSDFALILARSGHLLAGLKRMAVALVGILRLCKIQTQNSWSRPAEAMSIAFGSCTNVTSAWRSVSQEVVCRMCIWQRMRLKKRLRSRVVGFIRFGMGGGFRRGWQLFVGVRRFVWHECAGVACNFIRTRFCERIRSRIPVPRRHECMRRSQRLPASGREVIQLHYFSGLSHEEIARTLRITPQAVHGRLQRARRALASRLSKNSD